MWSLTRGSSGQPWSQNHERSGSLAGVATSEMEGHLPGILTLFGCSAPYDPGGWLLLTTFYQQGRDVFGKFNLLLKRAETLLRHMIIVWQCSGFCDCDFCDRFDWWFLSLPIHWRETALWSGQEALNTSTIKTTMSGLCISRVLLSHAAFEMI